MRRKASGHVLLAILAAAPALAACAADGTNSADAVDPDVQAELAALDQRMRDGAMSPADYVERRFELLNSGN